MANRADSTTEKIRLIISSSMKITAILRNKPHTQMKYKEMKNFLT